MPDKLAARLEEITAVEARIQQITGIAPRGHRDAMSAMQRAAKILDTPGGDRATARLLMMVEVLAAEMGYARGWKQAVAAELGIDRTYLHKLIQSEDPIAVRLSTVERICEKFHLRRGYFYDEGGEDVFPYFRDFIVGDGNTLVPRAARVETDLDVAPLVEAAQEFLDLAPATPDDARELAQEILGRVYVARALAVVQTKDPDLAMRYARSLAMHILNEADLMGITKTTSPDKTT